MKKNAITENEEDLQEKSYFRQAGEAIGSLGAQMVNAKDHVVNFMQHEVTTAKKTARKIGKKLTKAVKRRSIKNAAKKVAKKAKMETAKVPKLAKKAAKEIVVKKHRKKEEKKSAASKRKKQTSH